MRDRVALRILQAMAYDRQTFKNRIQEYISGAWLEFYKATLATKIGQTEWVQHWRTEVRNLLDRSLVAAIKHDIRGFRDKRKAISEVVASMKKKDLSYRRSAEMVVKKDYGITKLNASLDDTDSERFWTLVEQAIEIGLV